MQLYNYFKQNALNPAATDHVDFVADNIKVCLLENGGFTAADKYMADVLNTGNHAGVHDCGRTGNLASKTDTNGTAGAANPTASAVVTGHTINSIVVFKDTGSDATSPVIAFIDKQTDGVTAISLATNGSDILVSFSGSGIFDL